MHKNLILIFLFALIYFLCARLSLNLAFEKTNASPIWPPSGLAFAAVIIFGPRVLWSIFIGAVAVNLVTFQGNHQFSASIVLCSLMVGLGNTLEAYLGEKFYRSFNGEKDPLDSYQNYFKMLMVSFAACLAGALVGATSLLYNNIITFDLFRTVLATWWIGDYVGVLIFTPLILSLYSLKRYTESKENILEYTIHLVILIATSSVIFSNVGTGSILSELSFIILPLLLWMVYRFSVPYVSFAVLTISLISVFGTVNGYGPFVRSELNESLLLMQTFMGITSVTFIALAITLNKKSQPLSTDSTETEPRNVVWFTSLSFIISLAVSLFVIHVIEKKNNDLVLQRIDQQREILNSKISTELEFIVEGLNRMGRRTAKSGKVEPQSWKHDAQEYYNDYEIFKAIEWVDKDYRVQLAHPLKGNEHTIGLNLSFEPNRKSVLERSAAEETVVISDPVDLLQGGRGMVISVPVFKDADFVGFILGICEFKVLFKSFVREFENDYFVYVNIGDNLAYKSEDFYDNVFHSEGIGAFKNMKWNLKLIPKPSFLVKLGKQSNTFSIVLAFLISVLLSLTVYLVLFARSRASHLGVLNTSLRKKNEELKKEKEISQQAAVAKSDFLANMSHEIRTPMNGVLGALQLAMDSRDSEIRNYLKVIDISAKNLMDIINDILDYSKIEAGKLSLEVIPFDLSKVVSESLIIVEGKAKQQNIELRKESLLDPEKNFKGDPVRVRQILLNLLSNAVKFTTNGSVTVKTYLNQANQVCLEVIDTGIGIAKEKQKHIFEQFSQADTSTTREYGGTGLGLAITSQLVQLMDGSIEVESTIGEGTVFTVTLPLEQTDIKLVESKVDLERKYGKRVLLCEDNVSNQAIIKSLLNRLGLDVEIVGNGREAIELID
ncbi:MAG: MASE1 domain-containing protein, partial [Lentisphaeraceae bacterium]|nr:MASE1 domain-containing protein [Lentisphaeraceae bacterium]